MNLKIKILIVLGLMGVSAAMLPANNACATGTIANQTCDTNVWKAMELRATLETEREVMQNQNLIFKADSILNYTCFDKFAQHASENIGVLFTHTTYFNGQTIIPWGAPYGMDTALQNVVINSMGPYIEQNFGHTYLGGRGQEIGLTQSRTPSNISHPGSGYNCTVMNDVWAKAKCLNFLQVQKFADNDGFYPFANLTGTGGTVTSVSGYETKTDIRQFPTACGTTNPVTGGWKDMYLNSRNETSFGVPDRIYQYGTPLNEAFTQVRQKVEPGSCGTNSAAIKTGVKVILSTATAAGDVYDDGVCTNPGCSFTKAGTCTLATGG